MPVSESVYSLTTYYRKADKLMLAVVWVMFVYSLCLTYWEGSLTQALLVGGALAALPTVLYSVAPGSRLMRCTIAVVFMGFAALQIHLLQGMEEMHFGVFVLLAFLVYYRDWLPILIAAGVIAVHHVGFYAIQASGWDLHVIHRSETWGVIFLHAFYVVLESAILIYLSLHTRKQAVVSESLLLAVNYLTRHGQAVDLSYRISLKNELTDRFNGFLDSLDHTVGSVVSNSQGLSVAGEGMAKATSHMREGSRIQYEQITKVSSAIDQMGATISEAADQAQQAAQVAGQATKRAYKGSIDLNAMQKEFSLLAEHLEGTDEEMRALAAHSQQIGKVLEVIKAIAEQTNLLALNAAIEAARAGDQGRGFAVVADEVRALAQKTAASTSEIENIIGSLQMGSKSAVEAMQESRARAVRCASDVHKSAQSLQLISDDIRAINDINAQVAATSCHQVEVTGEVSKHLYSVRTVTEKNALEAEGLERESQRLKSLSEQFHQLSSVFKTSL
ncbi:methyl-accepting chemotaxis protein [Pseudomonas sp. LTJR-52]|uniref:methyl-accepting chemotaxis protein n=1 Tax=Pseudomonas sp. LTJR-52 TaxID=2479392 RepID=UPI000EFC6545|nr:methyl-accepting chemotaxis protein [Pseudomonas sp. LTJR-52]